MKKLLLAIVVILNSHLSQANSTVEATKIGHQFLNEMAAATNVENKVERAKAQRAVIEKLCLNEKSVNRTIKRTFHLSQEEIDQQRSAAPEAYRFTEALIINRYVNKFSTIFDIANSTVESQLNGMLPDLYANFNEEFAAKRKQMLENPLDSTIDESNIRVKNGKSGVFYLLPVIVAPEFNDKSDFALVAYQSNSDGRIRIVDLRSEGISFHLIMESEVQSVASKRGNSGNRFIDFNQEAGVHAYYLKNQAVIEAFLQ